MKHSNTIILCGKCNRRRSEDTRHGLSAYYIPSIVWNVLNALYYLNLLSSVRGRHHWYFHVTDRETEASKGQGQVTYLRSLSYTLKSWNSYPWHVCLDPMQLTPPPISASLFKGEKNRRDNDQLFPKSSGMGTKRWWFELNLDKFVGIFGLGKETENIPGRGACTKSI